MVLKAGGLGEVGDSYRKRDEVEVFEMKKCIESDRIGTVDGRDGRGGRTGEVVDCYSTAHFPSSPRADIDCAVGVLTKDKGTEEKLCLVMGNDGGEIGIDDEKLKGLEEVLADSGGGFTRAIDFGWLREAGDDLLEVRFPLGELMVLWVVE